MFTRCYNPKVHEKQPSYIGCTVKEEWHSLQNFGPWFEDNFVSGYHLDKDLLIKGNKVYSKETCIFIPERLNGFLTNEQSHNTSGFPGVNFTKANKKWMARVKVGQTRKSLGSFNTPEEASEVYQKARAIEASKLKEFYKDILPIADIKAII